MIITIVICMITAIDRMVITHMVIVRTVTAHTVMILTAIVLIVMTLIMVIPGGNTYGIELPGRKRYLYYGINNHLYCESRIDRHCLDQCRGRLLNVFGVYSRL